MAKHPAPSRRGLFVTVEGGEGVGKTYLARHLTSVIESSLLPDGAKLVSTREPGGTVTADAIRALFTHPPEDDPLAMETEALLVSAARAQHVERLIRPSLEAGHWVLCDRFADSTRVYQGRMGGLSDADVEGLIDFSTRGLVPDVTFVVDCEPELAQKRLAQRSADGEDGATRYDDARQSFHTRLREAFRELEKRFPERVVVLDSSAPIDSVVTTAFEAIRERSHERA